MPQQMVQRKWLRPGGLNTGVPETLLEDNESPLVINGEFPIKGSVCKRSGYYLQHELEEIQNPISAPSLAAAANPESGLSADTYYVAYTEATVGNSCASSCSSCIGGDGCSELSGLGGETKESPAASQAISSGEALEVTVPAVPSPNNPNGLPLVQYNIYVGTDPSDLRHQGSLCAGDTLYVMTTALKTDTEKAPSQRRPFSGGGFILSTPADADSSLPAGVYYVRVVWVGASGDMIPSAEQRAVVAAGEKLSVFLASGGGWGPETLAAKIFISTVEPEAGDASWDATEGQSPATTSMETDPSSMKCQYEITRQLLGSNPSNFRYDQDVKLFDGLPIRTNSTACSRCLGIFDYQAMGLLEGDVSEEFRTCRSRKLIVFFGDSMFTNGSGRGLKRVYSGLTPCHQWSAALLDDVMAFGNGVDPNIKWTGEEVTLLGLQPPPYTQGQSPVWTIQAPSGGAGTGIDAVIGYSYYIVYYNSLTNHRSAPTLMRKKAADYDEETGPLSDECVLLEWDSPSDPQVDKIEIYRNQDGGGTWYRLVQLSSSETSYEDCLSDDELSNREANFDTGVLPPSACIYKWKNRLWATRINGSPYSVRYSHINEDGADMEGFDPYNELIIETDSADAPVSLFSYADDLGIHVEDGVFKISGYDDQSWQQRRVFTTHGGIATRGWVNDDDVHYFVSQDGIHVLAGEEAKYGSFKLEGHWRAVSNREDIRNGFQAIRYTTRGKDQLWFAVARGSTQNNYVFVFDLLFKKWSIFTGFLISFLAIVEDSSGVDRVLSGDYCGRIFRHDARDTDMGKFIDFEYVTQPYEMSGQETSDLPRHLLLFHRRDSSEVYVDMYRDLLGTAIPTGSGMEVSLAGPESQLWADGDRDPADSVGSFPSDPYNADLSSFGIAQAEDAGYEGPPVSNAGDFLAGTQTVGRLWWSGNEDTDLRWAGGHSSDARTEISLTGAPCHRVQFRFFQSAILAGNDRSKRICLHGWVIRGRDYSVRSAA